MVPSVHFEHIVHIFHFFYSVRSSNQPPHAFSQFIGPSVNESMTYLLTDFSQYKSQSLQAEILKLKL